MIQGIQFERVPDTDQERSLLLATRPALWEYLLFASDLRRGMRKLDPKWRDHELRYRRPHGDELDDPGALQLLNRSLAQATLLTSNVTRVLDPVAVDRAFGPVGQPGDADRIEHLADRLTETCEALLDWAAELRGALVPDRWRDAVEALCRLADQPLHEIRDFASLTVTTIDDLPTWRRDHPDEHRLVQLQLTLTIDDSALAEFNAALARVRSGIPTES